MLFHLSHLLKPNKNPSLYFIIKKSFNSWPVRIKKASSSPHKALRIYSQMHRKSEHFDRFSVLFTLKSCTRLQDLTLIGHLHSHIIKLGFNNDLYISTCLLYAYAIASLDNASVLFDEMPERNTVAWNTMITGFSRSGNVDKARAFFDDTPLRDAFSWSAMITAYINNGNWSQGLSLFREMMVERGIKPDQVIVGSVLTGCAHMGSFGLLMGKSVHGFAVKNGWEMNVEIGTVFVDMYAKCAFFKNACLVFDLMRERNVMTWTVLICAAAQYGFSQEAITLFKMMQETGVKPNEMTFTGILHACARTGLVQEGQKYFEMIEDYGLERTIQHYGCMVDLFGKAGLLEEAYKFIKMMKFEPNFVVWGAFLSACKEHKQFDMAERVIEQVMREIKPENDGGVYTTICDLYVLMEKWDDAERIRELILNQTASNGGSSGFIRSGI